MLQTGWPVLPTEEARHWLALAEASTDHFVRHAMFAVHDEIARVAGDPDRPTYHFRSPARWMNDANGFIHHKEHYHVFYQFNPYGDTVGVHSTVWGHARSRDLVHWEHLPVALTAPPGVARINSGCTAVNECGRPMTFVPAVFDATGALDRPGLTREIWAALGDDDLVEWEFLEDPVMAPGSHGGPDYEKWDAPYIFEEDGRTLMILSSCHLDGRCVLPLYETNDPDMLRWDYLGLIFDRELAGQARYFECPMLFKDGERWALTTFEDGEHMRFYTGTLDLNRLQFEVKCEGVMQHGGAPHDRRPGSGIDRGFAGTSMNYDRHGRCLLLGWQSGFKAGRGWNGCMGLPRVLTIGADGCVRQQPVPELEVLRGRHFSLNNLTLNARKEVIDGTGGDTIEISASLEPGDACACGLKVRCRNDGTKGVEIRYDGHNLAVTADRVTEVPLERSPQAGALELRVFLDRSVLEVFADDGLVSISRVIYPPREDTTVALFAEGGSATVHSLDIWQMKPTWGG